MLESTQLNHHGRYREYLDRYEDACYEFRTNQGMQPKTWQGAVHEGATSMNYMGGRENLRDMVTHQGFKLR